MMADESSELSSISSLSDAPPSEDEIDTQPKKGIMKFFPKLGAEEKKQNEKKAPSSPPPPKREPSPPHEYCLADNSDIAFLVMFRSRFTSVLPKSLPNFGPQDLETGVSELAPSSVVESFLCALLGLLLNRKQDVKQGHYQRALEEAISTHKNQWPKDWNEKNPLSGGGAFTSMTPVERLTLLKTMCLWTLSSSDVVKGFVNQSYKQNRHEDDLNQPLSVQPWGADSDKRRYFLIEGLDDTAFRVCRESNPAGFNRTWWSVAGSIEELQALIDKLLTIDTGPKAKKLAQKMLAAIPRFEATEEKRKRREYRQQQKDRFKRAEPGVSLYEGRTRGKRMKYTYSDDEDFLSDSTGARRSIRNAGTNTPAEPVTTASGRQIKAPSRMTVDASNNIVTTSPEQQDDTQDQNHKARATSKESSVGPTGRPRRSAAVKHGTNGWTNSRDRKYNSMDDESESSSEPDLGDDEEEHVPEDSDEEEDDDLGEDEEMADDDVNVDENPKLLVKLKVPNKEGSMVNFDQFRYNGTDSKSAPTTTAAEPESEKTEDVISVAPRKRATPEPSSEVAPSFVQSVTEPVHAPSLTPSLQPTSLAYRESPDKLQGRPPTRPVDAVSGE